MKVKEFPAEVCVTLACCRVGATECGSVCMDLLKEVAINPTVESPELTQDWETDSWREQTKACVYQDPGERSSDPTRD